MNEVVVVGAGGQGREVLDVIESIHRSGKEKFKILGVLDDHPSQLFLDRLAAREVAYLGGVDDWLDSSSEALFAIGIGTPSVRKIIADKFEVKGKRPVTLIHPNAVVGSVCQVGEGSILCSGSHVATNVTLGRYVLLNPLVTVGHDSVLGDYCVANPSANVSGEVKVGTEVLVGTGAQILQGLRIGKKSIVGASACVTKDVPEGVTAVGVPARW